MPTFKSDFLTKNDGGLRRRPDYGHASSQAVAEKGNPDVHNPMGPKPKKAAEGSRVFPVRMDAEAWHIIGLPGEELDEGSDVIRKTPDAFINVSPSAKGLDLAEEIYRELYGEFQINDNLREGDIFDTPVGGFICQDVHVFPFDDKAKQAIAAVDESYKCRTCGCDRGAHRKRVDDQGSPYAGECGQHPQCKEYAGKPNLERAE
jgi:hypothetical protein